MTVEPQVRSMSTTDTRSDSPVVGIGAAAGGLDALRRFFAGLPPGAGISYVVLHQAAPGDEDTAAVVRSATSMAVVGVDRTIAIEPDHVYVVPPARRVSVVDGRLVVDDRAEAVGRKAAVDLLFRSLSEDHRERSCAVVLSGNGAAGAVGLTRVKELGGLTFAQAPDDARFDGMPRAAIATGVVDFVLPVGEMPRRLVDVLRRAGSIHLPAAVGPLASQPAHDRSPRALSALGDIQELVRQRTGHDFRHYTPATLLRRVERRLHVQSLHGLPEYRDFLLSRPEETTALLQDLLISVTNFFRDPAAFAAVERDVLPGLAEGRDRRSPLRVWIAGCATGEEAYSLAMLIDEWSGKHGAAMDFKVFATDIDERALEIARSGRYPRSIVADVDVARLRRFFTRDGDHYRVSERLRDRVVFVRHDVLGDPPFPDIDLVCCRNLLTSVDHEAQTSMLDAFRSALRPSGFLFLGAAESTDALPRAFRVFDDRARVFRVRKEASAGSPSAGPSLQPARRQGAAAVGLGEMHRNAMQRFAPASVLVDGAGQVLHRSANADRFLVDPAGDATTSLVSIVRPELRLSVASALERCARSGRSVASETVEIDRAGETACVCVIIRPLRSHDAGGGAADDPVDDAEPDGLGERPADGRVAAAMLVVFDEVEQTMRRAPIDVQAPSIVGRLEAEFDRLTRHLRGRAERSERSADALKASNEDLQAVVAQFRSASDKVDDGKEELRSVNEELVAVSRELKDRMAATARVNDDLQELVDSSEIATIFIDGSMRIRRYTPPARDIFNLIPSDVGRPLLDIRNRLGDDALVGDIESAFRSFHRVEREVDADDGRRFLVSVLPHRAAFDHADGATLTFVDITRLHRSRIARHEGQAHLQLAAEATRDFAIMTTDLDGVVTAWNKGAERMFGYTHDEIVGSSADILFTPEDRAAGVPQREIANARALGRAEDDRWHLRKDGTRFYCSGVVTPYAAGDLRGLAKIARDITGMRREQTTRDAMLIEERAARSAYEASSRLKDQFLAVMSHELKHPLNLIHVNAELLARMPQVRGDPAAVRAAQVIRKTVVGQGKIIDDLLDLSRLRTGKLAFEIQCVDLARTIEPIVAAASNEAFAKQIALTFEADADLGRVACDPVRVEQVAWNLLGNAVKFTPAGGRIDVRLEADGAHARLSVVDNGRGIPRTFLPHVFDMFGQEQGADMRGEGGMGIGLALVREFVVAQGGRVEAQSEGPQRGARFTVWLPLHRPVPDADPDFEADDADDHPGATLAGLRILVVEDSPEALEPFVELLRLEGAEPTPARDGRAAIALLDARDFDVLISDIAMPEVGGYELIAEVRRHPRAAGVVAVALTGYGRGKDRQKALDAGFDTHVAKPASLRDLRRAVGAASRRPKNR